MDLKKEFDNIISRYGYPVIYVRRDERIKCPCADSGEPSPVHELCMGTGYKISLEKHLTRSASSSVPESLTGILRFEGAGIAHPDAWVYFFAAEVDPKPRDLVLEPNGGRYVITSVEPLRQEGGAVAYYRVVARAEHKLGDVHV